MQIKPDKFTAMVIITSCISVAAVAQSDSNQQSEVKDRRVQSTQAKNVGGSGITQERQLQHQTQINIQEQTQIGRHDAQNVENQKGSQNEQENIGGATYQEQERRKEGRGEGQALGGANRHKGQYKSQPSIEGKSGPAGSKNKPQKSGR